MEKNKPKIVVPIINIDIYGVPLNDREYLWVKSTHRGAEPTIVAPLEFIDAVMMHIEIKGAQGTQGK